MIFLKESLYGWGVCNIPQPRATQDIFADRRTGSGEAVAVERREPDIPMGLLALWAAAVRRDCPVLQVVSIVTLSLFAIIMFGLASVYLPEVVEEEHPPLEILAMVVEEPPAVPEPEPVAAIPPPVVPSKPKSPPVKPAVIPQARPVIPPPTVALAPKRNVVTKLPPKVVAMPQKRTEEPVLPGPQTVARKYRATAPVPGPMPSGKPDAHFGEPAAEKVAVTASNINSRYSSGTSAASSALPQSSHRKLATGTGTEVDLPAVGGPQGNFKIASTPQSIRGSGSSKTFVPGTASPEVALGGGPEVGGIPNADLQSTGPVGIPSHNARSVGERVGVVGGTADVEVPVLVGPGKASGSFGGIEQGTSSPAGDGPATANVNFEGVEDGNYDPSRIISLNQLKACIDPDAELNLKTALATDLDTDGKCSIRAMVFFFKHPENAYTLQVDVFNPENFVDRCDALRTAIQCVNP